MKHSDEGLTTLEKVLDYNTQFHRSQRFAVKRQSQSDRSLEAFVRENVCGFAPGASEEDRNTIAKKACALIEACRNGTIGADYSDLVNMTVASDNARKCWDDLRSAKELAMKKIARKLPGYEFVKSVKGAGELGFAQIVGECGDLNNYPTIAKLWKKLGLAPYDGLAMSTWMRESWRPRKLTNAEWKANPFDRERYAVIQQVANWIWVAQWISAEKVALITAAIVAHPNHTDEEIAGIIVFQTGKKKGKPMVTAEIVRTVRLHPDREISGHEGLSNGHYGELYARRRAWTRGIHPEWSDGRRHSDAKRYMIKAYIKRLWKEWRRASCGLPERATKEMPAVEHAA